MKSLFTASSRLRMWSRRHLGVVLAAACVLGLGALIVAYSPVVLQGQMISLHQQKGPNPTPRATGPANPVVPLPAASPKLCGSWSSAGSAIRKQITNQYGEIRNCTAIGQARSVWLLTTLGTSTSHGVVGIYRCNTDACKDGSTSHPIAGWQFYPAPYPGGVTLLRATTASAVVVDNGGHELTFDVLAGTYS